MPTYVLLLTSRLTGNELGWVDIIFSAGLVALVMLSFLADQQQWGELNDMDFDIVTNRLLRLPKCKEGIPENS